MPLFIIPLFIDLGAVYQIKFIDFGNWQKRMNGHAPKEIITLQRKGKGS